MLKTECIECSGKKATFLFRGKTPIVGKDYHLENIEGKSLELNGLFHAIIPEFYYWMLKNDTFIFDDGGIELDFRCPNRYGLKDILKQKYGEGAVYKYADKEYNLCGQKDWDDVPDYVKDDYLNGNKKRIEVKLMSWGDYNQEQASKLVDIIIKLMNKLGVDTKKYLEIVSYLEKKEIETVNKSNYVTNIKNKFQGEMI